jgi:hypothetical protein
LQIQGNIFAYRVDFMEYVFFLDLIVFYEYFAGVPGKCTRKKSDSDGFVKNSNSPAKKQRDKKACKFWDHEAY